MSCNSLQLPRLMGLSNSESNQVAEMKKMKRELIYPQLGCGRLFIEKKNTCPNKTSIMHNVLLGVEESKIKEKNIYFYCNTGK